MGVDGVEYLDRYLRGYTVEICGDLLKRGAEDYGAILPEAEKVFAELVGRVRHNLEVIHAELARIDYKFWQPAGYDFEKPLLSPVSSAELAKLLAELEGKKVFMPRSLQFFVGL